MEPQDLEGFRWKDMLESDENVQLKTYGNWLNHLKRGVFLLLNISYFHDWWVFRVTSNITHTHTWWPSNLLSYHIRQKKKQNLLVPFPREWLFYVVLMVGEDHENFPRTFPKRHLSIGWVPTASPTGRCPALRICCRKSSCPLFWPKDDDASRCPEEGRCEDQWRW